MGLNARILNSIQLSPPAWGHSPMSSLNKYSLSMCVYILGWPGQSPCRYRVYVPTESWTTNNIIFDTPQWSKTKGEWQVGKIHPKRWYFSQKCKKWERTTRQRFGVKECHEQVWRPRASSQEPREGTAAGLLTSREQEREAGAGWRGPAEGSAFSAQCAENLRGTSGFTSCFKMRRELWK